MSSQILPVQISPNTKIGIHGPYEKCFFSTSKLCKCKNHMTIRKALKCSFKWVVLEICSSIRLEVIICSWQLSKIKIGSRLNQDCSNIFCNIIQLYIKINMKTIWPFERSWKDLSTERLYKIIASFVWQQWALRDACSNNPLINTKIHGH